jgi:orotate phosphoribosyltransferase
VSTPTYTPDDELAARIVTAPGVLRAGAGCWDRGRTPLHPLTLESAYADPDLLRAIGHRGARCACEFGVDVVVGAETGGVPLATAVSLAGDIPFAFVRKPGYRGHELDEPPTRGAVVRGRRVLLVDDAVSSGASLERFAAELADEGAELAGAFVLVDMRDVAEAVTPVACSVRTDAVGTYLHLLDLAADAGILAPTVHQLSVDALLNRWAEDDPRWEVLIAAV